MIQRLLAAISTISILLFTCPAIAADQKSEEIKVGITTELKKLKFTHKGEEQLIMRNQDQMHTVTPAFAKTSRPCPPFCVQPIEVATGVDTIGEIELIEFIRQMSDGDGSILVVDSRTPDWVERGTIPGAVNISWTKLNPSLGATTDGIIEVMTAQFGVKLVEGADAISVDEAIVERRTDTVFDYTDAKTLVMFCNGMWCGQSPANIRILLKFGYPAEKLKWYRGGMQAWEILGFNTVKAPPE